MATNLVQGTKEYVIIDVVDKKGILTTLDGTNPRFTVRDSLGVLWYTDEPASNIGLSAYCLVDTSVTHPMGLWALGEYRIDVTFDTPAEVPVLAPGRFNVTDP